MPSTSNLRMVPPLLLLPLVIFSPWAITSVAATNTSYNVGGQNGTWSPAPYPSFYQDWSDSINFQGGDHLVFSEKDNVMYDVWMFEDQVSFMSCNFSGDNVLTGPNPTYQVRIQDVRLQPMSPNSNNTVYFGSSDLDTRKNCENGMRFSVVYYTCQSSIAVSVVVVVLVLGAGICWWSCRIRRARVRSMVGLDPAPPMFRPKDPMPTLESIKVPHSSSCSNSSQWGDESRGSFSNSRSNSSAGLSTSPPSPLSHSGSTTSSTRTVAGKQLQSVLGSPFPNSMARTFRSSSLGRNGVSAYTELWEATQSFSPDCIIGKGGFGWVYKGLLPGDATPVAIKVAVTRHLDKAEEARRQLLNEVAVLSRAKHNNLVRLLGCCFPDEAQRVAAGHAADSSEAELILVYEFVPNGTLQDQLAASRAGQPTPLDWPTRFKLALQIAKALKYLHVDVSPPIFHRDVKTANILLDADWNAKVADFGLSRLKEDEDVTHVSTMVKGTFGYLDPDYFDTQHLTDKADVYSFGVVLLELLTARKPVDRSQPLGQESLAVMARPILKSQRKADVMSILDPQLLAGLSGAGAASKDAMQAVFEVAKVAVACLVRERAKRPTMSEVVEMLHMSKGSHLKPESFYSTRKLPWQHSSRKLPWQHSC